MREAPTQLKRSAKTFLKKLRKYGVTLDYQGNLDLSEVKEANVKKYLLKNESLVRLTLMQADLEFEYPQKLEKIMVKADILELANKEEAKFKEFADSEHETLTFEQFAERAEKQRRKVLTYEEYFEVGPFADPGSGK